MIIIQPRKCYVYPSLRAITPTGGKEPRERKQCFGSGKNLMIHLLPPYLPNTYNLAAISFWWPQIGIDADKFYFFKPHEFFLSFQLCI